MESIRPDFFRGSQVANLKIWSIWCEFCECDVTWWLCILYQGWCMFLLNEELKNPIKSQWNPGCWNIILYWVVVSNIFGIFTPKFGEDENQFWRSYFSKGLVQPPTSIWALLVHAWKSFNVVSLVARLYLKASKVHYIYIIIIYILDPAPTNCTRMALLCN